ncbi:MAG: hypothetical protein US89_C0005G0066 [Candidatus Peregrinibacteria bacterium GW2011_GWF2_38_29]|nr:MAG: hypothetical protein US89_C0005G0066 [Candidatus Peregrinibacteria bacterium GW2011_GWF2_38_29]HBB02653.1 hypothetical protein [Candidatus Peregrinibacteria bacterium]
MFKIMDDFEKTYGQWRLEADDVGYTITNPGADGKRDFYQLVKGPYGNPVIIAEPDRAFDAPNAKYVDMQGNPTVPKEKIAGIICKTPDGKIVHRFSLSSAKAPRFELVNGGEQIKIAEELWYLRGIFRKDANRIIGYDAFYGTEPQESGVVPIMELQDINF